jgi:hypothetical protein
MNFIKPHYQWKEVFVNTELTKAESSGVPDWARKASAGATFGNIDASDLKPPRLKVLAGMSPEVMNGTPGATPGNFWITILNQNLGTSVVGTPILLRKSYQLWAPKVPGSEQKGPLATASDGIHWDQPDQVFEVRFPGNPKLYKWHIKKTVFENSMHKFGSSQDDNPSSKPAATLTYDILWRIDLPQGKKQLCVFTTSKSGVTNTQTFISTTQAMGIAQFLQRYRIVVQRKTGPSGDPYFTYEFQYLSNVEDEKEGMELHGIWDQYRRSGFVAEPEIEEAPAPQRDATRDAPLEEDEIPF